MRVEIAGPGYSSRAQRTLTVTGRVLDALHLDSPLADNISGTLVGQTVATAFRYLTYGRLVFR